jgi:hypothetical protein
VIARVVAKRDDARVASFVTASAAIFLLLVLADDALHLGLFRAPTDRMYLTVAVAMAVAAVGPWLAWSSRSGRAVRLRCSNGLVAAGPLRIAAGQVAAISIAQAARGWSVAVKHGKHGKRVAFFEVERAEDAQRLAEILAPGPGQRQGAAVVLLPRSRALAVIQMLVTVAALVAAPLYYLAAMGVDVAAGTRGVPKALFGLAGVVAAELSFMSLILRQLWPNQALAAGARSRWEAHAAIHRERARVIEEGSSEEPAPATIEKVRIGGLERGDEDVGTWLTRIDAIPTEQHAYRGDALKKDVLWEALGDAGAPLDTRMAAARVLRRRYGEEEGALVRVVADADVRLRIEAALDEHDDAERRLERLGPLFRAR